MEDNGSNVEDNGSNVEELLNSDLQLCAADQSPKQSHHSQELDPAQILHRVLLAQVGHSIEDGAEQNQAVTQNHITSCMEGKLAVRNTGDDENF